MVPFVSVIYKQVWSTSVTADQSVPELLTLSPVTDAKKVARPDTMINIVRQVRTCSRY